MTNFPRIMKLWPILTGRSLLRGQLRRACFLIEDTVENLVESGFIVQQGMELFQVPGVVAPWNPDLQIAVRTILLV